MAYSFRLEIITPDDIYFSGDVISMLAPGVLGYFGVLVNHAPFVTPLRNGRVELRLANSEKKAFAIESGFFEVSYNQAKILVESVIPLNLAPSEFKI